MKRKSTVKAILSNLHALRERRYVGDLNASDTLIDFERACEMAKLTKRQKEAIHFVYSVGFTQEKAGKEMGVGQDVVSSHIDAATVKIDEIYEMWALMDEELTQKEF
ncbi:sigma factor-like helix-turn-helix DNA-binding protein [Lysinibacillus xylanilyticus]|uniref:RNA polymerase subunit sigma n=1 Tax=Lysinibacillus xylanilyticus TaxID=582475 RepID=A0ABT4EQM8_9BACI|nr:sigma factor-like helix-turn-helix DNA-binding protein [Lysinibacillus xylanilyticus]MCY9546801.1 RNA polymerase subunit sigma [Lysinibacillus xylanilyticus]